MINFLTARLISIPAAASFLLREIRSGLFTKRGALAALCVGAMVVMLSGTFAPLARGMPWGPALAGIGVLAVGAAGMAMVFAATRADGTEASGTKLARFSVLASGASLVAASAFMMRFF